MDLYIQFVDLYGQGSRHTKPPTLKLVCVSDGFVSCFLFAFFCLFALCVLRLWKNKSEAYIPVTLREGVDDGRAPLTRGFEEAAVTLYPVNSE